MSEYHGSRKAAFLLQKLHWLQILQSIRMRNSALKNEYCNKIKGLGSDDKLA